MKISYLFQSWLFILLGLFQASQSVAQNYIPQNGDVVENDDGKFIVKGTNIINNPSFEEGFTNWKSGDGSDLSDVKFVLLDGEGPDGSVCLKALSGAGSGSNSSIKTGWPVEIGKTYLFSCWAMRTTTGMSSNTQYSRIYSSDSETGTDTQIATLNYKADTWVQTQVIFTAEKPYCVGNFGWLNAATYLDCFYLGEVERSSEIVTSKLESLIAEAEVLYNETEEGSGFGQYKAEVRAGLANAIEKAKQLLIEASSQDQITEEVNILSLAMSSYKDSINPPFIVGEKYIILHRASGLLLTTAGSTGASIKISDADVENTAQVIIFEPVSEDAVVRGYNIRDIDGNYIYRSGSWDTFSGNTDLTAANAIFQVVQDGEYFQIKNMGSGSVLGTDGTSSGSAIYSNKNGVGVAKYDWSLKKYVPASERDDEYYYNELLEQALSLKATINLSMCGLEPFQYSQEAYVNFSTAIENAQSMTDFALAKTILQDAIDSFSKNKINKPDFAKHYIIQQSAGMNLSQTIDEYARVETPSVCDNQKFVFIQSDLNNAYFIQNLGTGEYLYKSTTNAWDTKWGNDNSTNEYKWMISCYSEGLYTIQNVAGKGYLGSNSVIDGSQLYCDKSASASSSQWVIEEFSLTSSLEKKIIQAEYLLSTTTVGGNYDQVPQSAMDELSQAIVQAKATIPNIKTLEEVTEATSIMEQAISTFCNSYNPIQEFDVSQTYIITHYSKNLLTTSILGNAIINTKSDNMEMSTSQQFVLEAVACDTLSMLYHIKNIETGLYLARTGAYNTQWQSNNDTLSTVFQIQHLDGQYLGLLCVESNTYLGTDGENSGSSIYSDKSGNGNTNSYWLIKVLENEAVNKDALNKALNNAKIFLESMTEGYKKDEYLLSIVQEYAEVYESDLKNAQSAFTQESIDSAEKVIVQHIEEFKGKSNSLDIGIDIYLTDLLSIYQSELNAITPGIDKGDYSIESIQKYQTVIDEINAVIGTANDEDVLILKHARDTFYSSVIVVDRAVLKNTLSRVTSALQNAVIGDFDGQYPQDAIQVLSNAFNKAKDIYDKGASTQEDIDVENQSLSISLSDFYAQKIVIDFAKLTDAISMATNMLCNAEEEKGEGPGTYPIDAFTILQEKIDEATAINGSKNVNQRGVNEMTQTLSAAIEVFSATRVPNDYSELQSLLNEADSLYINVTEGTEYGNTSREARESLKASIDKNSILLNSTSQTEINKAVKMLKRDISLFVKTIIVPTSINSIECESIAIYCEGNEIIADGALQITVYDMHGKLLCKSCSDKVLLKMTQPVIVKVLTSKGGIHVVKLGK